MTLIAAEMVVRQGRLEATWSGIALAAPQLLLVPTFLLLILCLDNVVMPENRIWGNLAVAFALLYALLMPMVCVLLAISLIGSGNDAAGRSTLLADDSFVSGLNGLGRVYMCVSAMFAGLAFDRSGLQNVLRWLGSANGFIAIAILAACLGFPNLFAGLWAVSIPAFAFVGALFFREMKAAR
jgi:hypothetical protein